MSGALTTTRNDAWLTFLEGKASGGHRTNEDVLIDRFGYDYKTRVFSEGELEEISDRAGKEVTSLRQAFGACFPPEQVKEVKWADFDLDLFKRIGDGMPELRIPEKVRYNLEKQHRLTTGQTPIKIATTKEIYDRRMKLSNTSKISPKVADRETAWLEFIGTVGSDGRTNGDILEAAYGGSARKTSFAELSGRPGGEFDSVNDGLDLKGKNRVYTVKDAFFACLNRGKNKGKQAWLDWREFDIEAMRGISTGCPELQLPERVLKYEEKEAAKEESVARYEDQLGEHLEVGPGTNLKVCPKCGRVGDIDSTFGWRNKKKTLASGEVKIYHVPQGQCYICRGSKVTKDREGLVETGETEASKKKAPAKTREPGLDEEDYGPPPSDEDLSDVPF